MLQIVTIPVTPLSQNCRILFHQGEDDALVIDPGGDTGLILSELNRRELVLREIWLTHSHFDHCGGVAPLIAATGASLTAHPIEKRMRESVEDICRMYGIPPGIMVNCPEPSRKVTGGERLTFGDSEFLVLFTPGHSPGSVTFHHEREKFVLSGDVLFAESIGRTDLPGGDYGTLMESIRQQLFPLSPDTRILSGHGPDTTLERELRVNPFLKDLR